MIKIGSEYQATGDDAEARGIKMRRAVYDIRSMSPTPEQRMLIERLEKGFHGDWQGRDPYDMMRQAQYMGIELSEEELCEDGVWRPVVIDDTRKTLMMEGTL